MVPALDFDDLGDIPGVKPLCFGTATGFDAKMPRSPRADEAGGIDHALNRANMGTPIFKKERDFLAFENVPSEALHLYQVELFSYQIISNHWHLIIRLLVDGEMGRFCKWVGGTHTMRYHAHYKTAGGGHLYQGRFKSFPIQDGDHFLAACRYVERNAESEGGCSGRGLAMGLTLALAARDRA